MGLIDNFIFFIIGTIFGITIYRVYLSKISENTNRRGLLSKSFSLLDGKIIIPFDFDIIETDRSDKLSKIKVISVKCSNSFYNTSENLNKIKSIIDGTWIESNEIKFLSFKNKKRRDKLLNFLSKK